MSSKECLSRDNPMTVTEDWPYDTLPPFNSGEKRLYAKNIDLFDWSKHKKLKEEYFKVPYKSL